MRPTIQAKDATSSLDEFLGTMMVALNASLGVRASTLWTLDYEAKLGRLAMSAVDGRWCRVPPQIGGAALKTALPFDATIASKFSDLKAPYFIANVQRHPDVDPGTRAWLRHLETVALQELPIVVDEKTLAVLDIHSVHGKPLAPEKLELAVALCQQLGVVIHATRQAEEAKAAAIARERQQAAEQRKAELARANAPMRSTCDVRTSISALDDLLASVMLSINEHLAAPGATLWSIGEAGSSLQLTCIEGSVFREPPECNGYRPASFIPHQQKSEEERNALYQFQHDFLPDAWQRPHLDDQSRGWILALGVSAFLIVPLRFAGKVLATLCVHKLDNAPFPAEQAELAVVLAQQAALAMHVSQLAEEAKQAAIAREREEAATQRAAVLARANAAMARTVGRLVEQPNIRNFIGEVLSVVAAEFEAVGVEFWRLTGSARGFVPTLNFDRASGALEGEGNEWHALNRLPTAKADDRQLESLAGRITRSTVADFETDPAFAPFREKLRETGIRTILGVPMFIKDECFGVICLRFNHDRTLQAPEEELAFALAQQLALALQMTRLAEEAKATAVAREQDRATLAERSRMSEEIHDGMQQVFTAILLQLGTAQRKLEEFPAGSAEARNAVTRAETLAETGLEEVQRSVAYLRHTLDDNPGDLHRSLNTLCRSVDSDGLRCRFISQGATPSLSTAACKELYRICQEALSNSCKHARAGEIRLRAHSDWIRYRLTISDDGCGFAVPADASSSGLGMRTMQERAKRIGGTCEIRSSPGEGTVVTITVELPQPTA